MAVRLASFSSEIDCTTRAFRVEVNPGAFGCCNKLLQLITLTPRVFFWFARETSSQLQQVSVEAQLADSAEAIAGRNVQTDNGGSRAKRIGTVRTSTGH